MATVVEQAVIAAYNAARRLAGVSLTYTRGANSVVVTAIPGRSTQTVEVGDTINEVQTRDYLILASELILSGAETTPQRGDTITVGLSVLDLLSVSGEPVWRYSDQTRQVIRIHAKD